MQEILKIFAGNTLENIFLLLKKFIFEFKELFANSNDLKSYYAHFLQIIAESFVFKKSVKLLKEEENKIDIMD